MKIGVFDSGIGGITVLTELRRRIPSADYIYLGDTANVPYGTKSPSQIEKLSVACAKILKAKNIDILVVACNTASSLALPSIRQVMGNVPIYGVVEPGVEAAMEALITVLQETAGSEADTLQVPVLVLATRATIKSGSYGRRFHEVFTSRVMNTPVIEQPCPLLVPMIEEGWVDHPVLHLTIREYVLPYLKIAKPGVALLGCTHYPWVHSAFEKALPGWKIVNSAEAIAAAVARGESLQLAPVPSSATVEFSNRVEWIFTDPEALPDFALRLIE